MSNLETLILALKAQDFQQAEALIKADATLLQQRTAEKLTALDYFCRTSNAPIVEWLCEKLTSLSMSVDIYDNESGTAIHNSYSNNNVEIVKILLKYSTVPNLREWLVQHQLVCVIGANFLYQNNILLNQKQTQSAEGGFVIESAHVMCSAINHLIETGSRYAEIKESIENFYDNTCIKNQPSKLLDRLIDRVNQQNKPRVLFNSGCLRHTFTVSIQKQTDGVYQLSFYDSNCPDDGCNFQTQARMLVTGEIAIVRRINVSTDKLSEVVLKLLSDKHKSKTEVYAWINSLPEKLNNPFQYDQNILVNIHNQEDHRCYWKNPKYAVMDLFIDKFGVELGTQEFNNFLTSINIKILENFKKTFENQYDEQAIKNLEAVLRKTSYVQPPMAYATKATFSILTSISAAVAAVCCGYAALGIPAFIPLAIFLGPVGLIVASVVAVILIFHEWILDSLTSLIFASNVLLSNKMSPLIQEADQSKLLVARSKQVDLPLPEPIPASSIKQPLLEENTQTNSAPNKRSKSTFSLITQLFKKSSKKITPAPQVQQVECRPQLTTAKETKNSNAANGYRFSFADKPVNSLSMQEDLNDLWSLPMSSVLSRLQG